MNTWSHPSGAAAVGLADRGDPFAIAGRLRADHARAGAAQSHRPDLRVAVVVEQRFAAVFEGNPDIDEILSPGVGGCSDGARGSSLNLHGGTRSMVLTLASGAGIRAGFAHHRYSFLYSREDSAGAGDSGRGAARAHGGTSGLRDVLAGRAASRDSAGEDCSPLALARVRRGGGMP